MPLIFNPAGSVFILCCKIHQQYGLLHLQASPYGSPCYLSCSISHTTYQCQIASGIAEGTKEKLVHPSHKAQKHKASRGSQTHRVLSYKSFWCRLESVWHQCVFHLVAMKVVFWTWVNESWSRMKGWSDVNFATVYNWEKCNIWKWTDTKFWPVPVSQLLILCYGQ